MPVRRRPLNWRSLTPEAMAQLGVALDRFTGEAGCFRRELAQALELNASDLAPSHLQNRAMLAHWALRRDELLQLIPAPP